MHIPTLAWSLILVLVALATLGAVVASYRRDRAMTSWAVGMAGSAVGFFVLLMQGSLPVLVAPLFGNALVLAFDLSLPVGMGYFVGDPRPWKRRFSVYLVGWSLVMLTFSVVWPLYPVRASITSAFITLFTAEFLVLLIRRGRDIPGLLRKLLITVGVAFALFHGLRAALILFSNAPTLLSDEAYTSVTLSVTLVFSVVWAGALLLADAGRLQSQVSDHSEELLRLNALKDRVLAITSHDLRGPLGNLHLLWGELTDRIQGGRCEDVDRDLLGLVDRSLTGTQSLLENLFSFAESQSSAPDPAALTELRSAAEIVMAQWDVPARTKGVSLVLNPGPGALGRASSEAVITVLRNLVGNAVKYTPRGGSVTVGVVPGDGPDVVLEVVDTGIGMAPELLGRTFALESRSSRIGTDGERGSGFGLVLVKELVGGWGGSLSVESEPGKGTTVRVSLPRGV